MKSKNILTLLICAGLGLSVAATAMADSIPATTATSQKIEALHAKRKAALEQQEAARKAEAEKRAAAREAKIEARTAKKEERIDQRAANKEATVQAHKDANAAKKEILQKNRDAIKASKVKTTGTAQ